MLFKYIQISALLAMASLVAAIPIAEPQPETCARPEDCPPDHVTLMERASGRGTVYYQGGAHGSCGQQHGDGDHIAALGTAHMTGPNSPNCGRRIKVRNNDNGKEMTVTVADTCAACGGADVDLAVGPWNILTNNAAPGVFSASWNWA